VSDTATRVLVALIAIPGILFLACLGGYAWAVFIAVVQIAALLEFSALMQRKGAAPQRGIMITASLLLLLVFLHERIEYDVATLTGGTVWPLQWQAFVWILMLFMSVTLLVELFRNRPSPLLNIAATVFGVGYIGLFLASAVGIREIFTVVEFPVGRVFGTATLNDVQQAQLQYWGGGMMVALLVTIWVCDSAAYFGGRAMGRNKLFPRVSPNKTVEGAIWGAVTALVIMAAAQKLALDFMSMTDALIIGAIVGVGGQLGDLVESLLKRDAGVKDSSSLLPGHGGVFDRFDSLIFVSPAVFLYLDFIVFA
jgi:phosphatidate cytidylyltransferase